MRSFSRDRAATTAARRVRWMGRSPAGVQDAARRGFHDGIEGARKDYDNHRRPDVNNRDEYRHPHIERALRHDYREGFRRGYDTGVQHLMNGGPGPR